MPKIKVKVDINTKKIMQQRGLGVSNEVRKHLANDVRRLSDPYVPMDRGILKNGATIAEDGSSITYHGPYAHYQYHGEVMVGKAPKEYGYKSLNYQGEPMRGPVWDRRMLSDKSKEIVKSLAEHIKNQK